MSMTVDRESVKKTSDVREKIARRIQAVARWKFDNLGKTLPDELDIDELAPGTGDVGPKYGEIDSNGVRIKKSDDDQEARPFRKRGQSEAEFRQRRLISIKRRNGGVIGLTVSRDLTCRVTYSGKRIKETRTFAAGAEIYDEIARQVEGSRAVTNDPEAVEQKDRMLNRLRECESHGMVAKSQRIRREMK